MDRKDFLKKFVLSTVILQEGFAINAWADSQPFFSADTEAPYVGQISNELEKQFMQLLNWMKQNKWTDYLKKQLNLNLELSGDALQLELTKPLDKDVLAELRSSKNEIGNNAGYNDFCGNQLIKPGYPSFSLLYHALASPRVKLKELQDSQYPTLLQLDILENYIYGLKNYEDLKKDYLIGDDDELQLAVFAYEYRPAYTTPHRFHADLVFSRTGVARIGEYCANYDGPKRSFSNKPSSSNDSTGKGIAVTPARYGLFLAKKVHKPTDNSEIKIMRMSNKGKGWDGSGDQLDDLSDTEKTFLLPIRKVFQHDLLFGKCHLTFSENHINKKIFLITGNSETRKTSAQLIVNDTAQINTGSSFLIIPKHLDLIRPAVVNDKILTYRVRKRDDRYFTTLNKYTPAPIELLYYSNNAAYRSINTYLNARNEPMYWNITHSLVNDIIKPLPRGDNNEFEKMISKGGYDAVIFEDSICDGCVTTEMTQVGSSPVKSIIDKGVTAAFSIVTAPDFFPFVNGYDLVQFDVSPGFSRDSVFFEGGIASLASSRIRPNIEIELPSKSTKAFPSQNNNNTDSFTTYTSVVSNKAQSEDIAFIHWEKDFQAFSYLPDGCSSVFAPGWDITFSGSKTKSEIYLSTQGLGAPFIEDMKLCSAMNGMWPAAAPDTARSYQGSVLNHQQIDNWRRNPTAIPLMDKELGYHKLSPAGKINPAIVAGGWDGEEGPFLEKLGDKWVVDFSDLGRVDYVENARKKKFNMNLLRNLTARDFVHRMICYKQAYTKINSDFELTGIEDLWLISAEKVDDWSKTASVAAYNVPTDLIAAGVSVIKTPRNGITGEGYLFVFALTNLDHKKVAWVTRESLPDFIKRRTQVCRSIYVCQSTLALTQVGEVSLDGTGQINWI